VTITLNQLEMVLSRRIKKTTPLRIISAHSSFVNKLMACSYGKMELRGVVFNEFLHLV